MKNSVLLKVSKSTFGGEGVASHEGKVCFVLGALPGETVEAEILQDKKNFLRARTLRIVEASPERVPAPCPYYGYCGGCQYQHASYEAERRFKEAQVAETLEHIAGLRVPVRPMLYSKEYGYRNSAAFHISRTAKKGKAALSFISQDNESEVAVKRCDLLDARFAPLLEAPFSGRGRSEKISFKLSEKGEIISDEDERFFRIRVGGQSLLANSQGFFQTNLAVTELLSAQVKEWTQAAAPDIFVDLYSGVGTFSWLSAGKAPRIVCAEENAASLSALRMNREERKAEHMEIVPGRVEKTFPALWKRLEAKEAVLLMDPPRQGIAKSLAESLASLEGASTLIYISCDIPTLARDLKLIVSRGRFAVKEVVPFDMFPRTKHIEAAVLLMNA